MGISTRAKILRPTPRNVERLARALREGQLVAVPTETVYGLAADAFNPEACREIFRAKGRPANDPLIVHIYTLGQLKTLAHSNPAATRMAKAFWPGPLTLVLPKKDTVSDIVTSGQDSVAVRMPRHAVFRKLLRLTQRPLAAPSANPFGYISPTTAAHVAQNLGDKIPFILDGGPCAIGLESTILDLRDPKRPAILRPGAIERSAIERVLGRRVSVKALQAKDRGTSAVVAPGSMARHYSPRTPLLLHARLTRAHAIASGTQEAFVFSRRPAWMSEAKTAKTIAPANIFWLTAGESLKPAAHRLFSLLRELDAGRWKRLHFELATGESALALAINDRLVRAAAKV